MIVQDDVFDSTESVTIVPLTTMLTDAPLLRMRAAAVGLPGLALHVCLLPRSAPTPHPG